MSERYEDLYLSKFPDQADDLVQMSDPEVGDLPLIDAYNGYMRTGNLNAAASLLAQNTHLIPKLFNADKFNKLMHSILSVQRVFRDDIDGFTEEIKVQLEEEINDFRYVGEYNPEAYYRKKNIVIHLNCGYLAIVDSFGEEPIYNESSPHWSLIAKGIQGQSGLGLSPRGHWNETINYYIQDWVVHNNKIWECMNENINSEPMDSSSDWNMIMMFTFNMEEIENRFLLLESNVHQNTIDIRDLNLSLNLLKEAIYEDLSDNAWTGDFISIDDYNIESGVWNVALARMEV